MVHVSGLGVNNRSLTIDTDMDSQLSEEIVGAERNIPRVLLLTTLINGSLGFGMLIAALFCLGDIDLVSASPTGFTYIGIIQQGISSKAGGSIMVVIIVIMTYASTLSFVASASRITWSLARDRGVPGWAILKRVSDILTSTDIY